MKNTRFALLLSVLFSLGLVACGSPAEVAPEVSIKETATDSASTATDTMAKAVDTPAKTEVKAEKAPAKKEAKKAKK